MAPGRQVVTRRYALSSEPKGNSHEMEEQARAFHARVAGSTEDLWVHGINLLLDGLNSLSTFKVKREEERVMAALFVQAWNSQYCAHDLALRGYYAQGLNLVRIIVEDWLAYWYLRNCPEEHARFSDFSQRTPSFNDMLQKIESRQQWEPDPRVRAWIKRLHRFSHVDSAGIKMITSRTDDGIRLAMGPGNDELRFNLCASEAMAVIPALLEAMDNFLRLTGHQPLARWEAFSDRLQSWYEQFKPGESSAGHDAS